jgi:hypothetical protein
MRAFGYDCQQASSLRRALGMGLDAVFSDHVETMLAVFAATNRIS